MNTNSLNEDRVRKNTADKINTEIDDDTARSIAYYKRRSSVEIAKRIKQLNNEWDVERVLELNASLIALSGIILAARKNKRWLILPVIVTSFLAMHAIQGWCPPLPVLRKLKFRTVKEIDQEKFALLSLLEENKGRKM